MRSLLVLALLVSACHKDDDMPDMTAPPDLTALPDLTPQADLTKPPDLTPRQWMMQTSNTNQSLSAIWGPNGSNLYTVGTAGVILHSTGNGTWVAETNTGAFDAGAPLDDLYGLTGTDATHL